MKVLAIKNFNTDLFELNLRQLMHQLSDLRLTIAGDRNTTRRVPKGSHFSTWQLARKTLFWDVMRCAYQSFREPFDIIFYGYDDETGFEYLCLDFLVGIIPWKRVVIARELELFECDSRLVFWRNWFSKIIPTFFKRPPLQKSNYKLGFIDSLLNADPPIDFQFDSLMHTAQKRTFRDETRNCIVLHDNKPLQLQFVPTDINTMTIGLACSQPEKKTRSHQEPEIKINLLEGTEQKFIIKQPLKTLLTEWNDHTVNVRNSINQSNAENVVLKYETSNSDQDIFISFPVFLKRLHRKNIVVIILDGINKNHLGIYNPESSCSPNIDKFFNGKLRYNSAFSQEIWTRPTFASMMTSFYPSHHKFADKIFFLELPPQLPNLAEELKKGGYHTSAYISHRLANQLYGFSRGFDRFIWRQTGEKPNHNARDITYFGIESLQQNQAGDQFILLHYFDTHLPFFPRSPYHYYDRQVDFRDASEVYQACKSSREFCTEDILLLQKSAANKTREVDAILEPLLAKLGSKDFCDNTSVILTADHGFARLNSDAVFEKGFLRLCNETVQVPLLVSPALNTEIDAAQNEIDELVESSIDLYPSVMDLAGINTVQSPYAKSYIPSKKINSLAKSHVVSEAIYFDLYQLMIRTKDELYYLRCSKELGGFRVFADKTDKHEALFDLIRDPFCTQNIWSNEHHSERFRQLRIKLGLAEFTKTPASISSATSVRSVAGRVHEQTF